MPQITVIVLQKWEHEVSGICQQFGRNRNRIVKMAGYPANRNRISGTSYLLLHARWPVKRVYRRRRHTNWRVLTTFVPSYPRINRLLDLRSAGHRFDSGPSHFHPAPWISRPHACNSVTQQYNLVPANGRWFSAAGKVVVVVVVVYFNLAVVEPNSVYV